MTSFACSLLKKLVAVLFVATLSACGTAEIKDTPGTSLQPGEGYLALVIDTLDPLNSIHIDGNGKGLQNLTILSAPRGVTLKLFKVQEGQYCIRRFYVYALEVTYQQDGLCFFVEQGEVNYPGTLYVRNPVTSIVMDQKGLITLLNKDYPALCHKQFGDYCAD